MRNTHITLKLLSLVIFTVGLLAWPAITTVSVPVLAASESFVGGSPYTDNASNNTVRSNDCADVSNCGIIERYLKPAVNVLAALVGIVVVVSVVIGGIQYSSSGGDPQKVAGGRRRIVNALIALIVFIFLYAILSFLIPGGLGVI